MQLFLAKVRVNGRHLVEVHLIAQSAPGAKQRLEVEYGEDNVVHYPRLIS